MLGQARQLDVFVDRVDKSWVVFHYLDVFTYVFDVIVGRGAHRVFRAKLLSGEAPRETCDQVVGAVGQRPPVLKFLRFNLKNFISFFIIINNRLQN